MPKPNQNRRCTLLCTFTKSIHNVVILGMTSQYSPFRLCFQHKLLPERHKKHDITHNNNDKKACNCERYVRTRATRARITCGSRLNDEYTQQSCLRYLRRLVTYDSCRAIFRVLDDDSLDVLFPSSPSSFASSSFLSATLPSTS